MSADLHQELAITRRQPVDSAPVEDGDDICLPKQIPSTGEVAINFYHSFLGDDAVLYLTLRGKLFSSDAASVFSNLLH